MGQSESLSLALPLLLWEITSLLYSITGQSQVGRDLRGHLAPPPAQRASTYPCVRPQMLWVQHLPKELACIKLYMKHLKWGQTQHLVAFPTKKSGKMVSF